MSRSKRKFRKVLPNGKPIYRIHRPLNWQTWTNPPKLTEGAWQPTRHVKKIRRGRSTFHDRSAAKMVFRDRQRISSPVGGTPVTIWSAPSGGFILATFPGYTISLRNQILQDVRNGRLFASTPIKNQVVEAFNNGTQVERARGHDPYPYVSFNAWEYVDVLYNAVGTFSPDVSVEYSKYLSNRDAYDSDSWYRMYPSLNNTDTDILDFTYELPELVPLFEEWVLTTSNWRILLEGIALATPGVDTLAAIANANLAWQFGVKPFVSDCQNLFTRLTQMREKMDAFCGRAGIINKSHVQRPLFSGTDSFSVDCSLDGVGHHWAGSAIVKIKRSSTFQYRANCMHMYTLPDLEGVWSTIAKYMTYLGVVGDASTLWNEIPFSFVVDWFYNIARFLHDHRFDLYKVNVKLIDFCNSTKATNSVSGTLVIDGNEYPIGTLTYIDYERARAAPSNATQSYLGSPWTLTRTGIAASLGGQRTLKFHK